MNNKDLHLKLHHLATYSQRFSLVTAFFLLLFVGSTSVWMVLSTNRAIQAENRRQIAADELSKIAELEKDLRNEIRLLSERHSGTSAELKVAHNKLAEVSKLIGEKQKQFDQLVATAKNVQKDLVELEKYIDNQGNKKDGLHKELEKLKKNQKDYFDQLIRMHGKENVPLDLIAVPRASVRATTDDEKKIKGESITNYYSFWFELPEDQYDRLDRVEFFLEHKTFPENKNVVVGTKPSNFKAGYFGYGALANIRAVLIDKSGKRYDSNVPLYDIVNQ